MTARPDEEPLRDALLDGLAAVLSSIAELFSVPPATEFRVDGEMVLHEIDRSEQLARKLAPAATEPAGRVVFEHDDALSEQFRSLLTALRALYARSPDFGRSAAMFAALELTCEIINRLPISLEQRGIILEPLRLLQKGLDRTAARPGHSGVDAPIETSGPTARPPVERNCAFDVCSLRRRSMRSAAMVIVLWPSVHHRPRSMWALRPKGGFGSATVHHWRKRQNAKWNQWVADGGNLGDETTPEIRARALFELQRDLGIDERYRDAMLRSLDVENIDRPVSAAGRGYSE